MKNGDVPFIRIDQVSRGRIGWRSDRKTRELKPAIRNIYNGGGEGSEGVKDTLKTIPTINRPVFSRRPSETPLYSISPREELSFKGPRFQCPGTKRGYCCERGRERERERERGKENVRESP